MGFEDEIHRLTDMNDREVVKRVAATRDAECANKEAAARFSDEVKNLVNHLSNRFPPGRARLFAGGWRTKRSPFGFIIAARPKIWASSPSLSTGEKRLRGYDTCTVLTVDGRIWNYDSTFAKNGRYCDPYDGLSKVSVKLGRSNHFYVSPEGGIFLHLAEVGDGAISEENIPLDTWLAKIALSYELRTRDQDWLPGR